MTRPFNSGRFLFSPSQCGFPVRLRIPIAERVGWSQPKVVDFITNEQVDVSNKAVTLEYTCAHHAEEGFQVPLYSVRKSKIFNG